MTDTLGIAHQRIAEEAEAKTGTLYLRHISGLEKLPDDIKKLAHLQTLDSLIRR
ncbi:MAG: hypothetical protein ACRBM6_06740 [Geminicoccales bacterium]